MLENDNQAYVIKDVFVTIPNSFTIKNNIQLIGGWINSKGHLSSFDSNGNLTSFRKFVGATPIIAYGICYVVNNRMYYILGGYSAPIHFYKAYTIYNG